MIRHETVYFSSIAGEGVRATATKPLDGPAWQTWAGAVAPVFNFSGGWQRTVAAASAVPFVVSLAGSNTRTAQHD